MNLRMTPVDLDKQMEPRDPRLYAALQAYAERELGGKLSVPFYQRLWAIEATKEDDPEYSEVIGVTATRFTPDVQIFHVTPPTNDREGLKLAMQARDMMVYRLASYFADSGYRGAKVLIYVSEQSEPLWKRFFKRRNIESGRRYEILIA
jgi:hypothetical protein